MAGGTRGGDDGRRARKIVTVPGLLEAIDYLDQHDPVHAGRIWDDIGREKRRRLRALIDRIAELMTQDPERYGRFWGDVDRAIYAITSSKGGSQ